MAQVPVNVALTKVPISIDRSQEAGGILCRLPRRRRNGGLFNLIKAAVMTAILAAIIAFAVFAFKSGFSLAQANWMILAGNVLKFLLLIAATLSILIGALALLAPAGVDLFVSPQAIVVRRTWLGRLTQVTHPLDTLQGLVVRNEQPLVFPSGGESAVAIAKTLYGSLFAVTREGKEILLVRDMGVRYLATLAREAVDYLASTGHEPLDCVVTIKDPAFLFDSDGLCPRRMGFHTSPSGQLSVAAASDGITIVSLPLLHPWTKAVLQALAGGVILVCMGLFMLTMPFWIHGVPGREWAAYCVGSPIVMGGVLLLGYAMRLHRNATTQIAFNVAPDGGLTLIGERNGVETFQDTWPPGHVTAAYVEYFTTGRGDLAPEYRLLVLDHAINYLSLFKGRSKSDLEWVVGLLSVLSGERTRPDDAA